MSQPNNTKDFDKRTEVDIVLNYPVTVDGQEHKTLTMRRPKGKDSLKAASYKGSDAKRGMLYFADLCGVSPDVIEELDEVDTDQLSEQLQAFTGRRAA